MKKRVLFVCLGNICRSPTADGIFRSLLKSHPMNDQIEVDSAGTGGWHAGDPPDSRMQSHAKKRGYDLSILRARQVTESDFQDFDYILAMDRSNLSNLERIQPANSRAKLQLMGEYHSDPSNPDVPDPYYGGASGFEKVLDLLEEACGNLLETVAKDCAG